MPNRQERYTTTGKTKENCTERMQPSGIINMYQWPLYQFQILLMMGACARNMQSDSAEIKPAQCCIKLVFHLTYTMMHGSTKLQSVFSSSKCGLFHNSNIFGSCIIHILHTGCAKIKKKFQRQKVKHKINLLF